MAQYKPCDGCSRNVPVSSLERVNDMELCERCRCDLGVLRV